MTLGKASLSVLLCAACAPGARDEATHDGPDASASAIARDAPLVAAALEDGAILVLDARSGRRRASLAATTILTLGGAREVDPVRALAITPRGERVAWLTCSGAVYEWRVDGDPQPRRLDPEDPPDPREFDFIAGFLAYSPTGGRLLVADDRSSAQVFDAGGRRAATLEGLDLYFFGEPLEWHPDGDRIAAVRAGRAVLLDADTGAALPLALDPEPRDVTALALSNDGATLAVGGAGVEVGVYDLASGRRRSVHSLQGKLARPSALAVPAVVGALAFSPDDSRVAATTAASLHALVLEVGASGPGRHFGYFGGRMGEPASIAWSPTGHRFHFAFVTGGMEVQTVHLVGDGVVTELGRGDTPQFGWNGHGVHIAEGQLRCYTRDSLRARWVHRP